MEPDRGEIPAEGDVLTYERTFTSQDVRAFGELTGDQQSIHTDPDEEGRLVVQGLLTGSLMTKIGGDLSYIARTMTFDFRQPVYSTDTITCEWRVDSKEEQQDRYRLENTVIFQNDSNEVVCEASTTGLIWKTTHQ